MSNTLLPLPILLLLMAEPSFGGDRSHLYSSLGQQSESCAAGKRTARPALSSLRSPLAQEIRRHRHVGKKFCV
jgi:hypothetical protein